MRSLAPAGAVALPALLVVLNGCAVGPDFAPPPLALTP
jgi:hypothetical protein